MPRKPERIDPLTVYTVPDPIEMLRLTRTTLRREIKLGRLRVAWRSKRMVVCLLDGQSFQLSPYYIKKCSQFLFAHQEGWSRARREMNFDVVSTIFLLPRQFHNPCNKRRIDEVRFAS
jgi:hypothetical protein